MYEKKSILKSNSFSKYSGFDNKEKTVDIVEKKLREQIELYRHLLKSIF